MNLEKTTLISDGCHSKQQFASSRERQQEQSQLPSLGVLITGLQGPAVGPRVPSLRLPSQEQIQVRRQRVKRKVKSLLKRKLDVERPIAGKLRERMLALGSLNTL